MRISKRDRKVFLEVYSLSGELAALQSVQFPINLVYPAGCQVLMNVVLGFKHSEH